MPKWIELVLGVMITTNDNYFVLCGSLDPPIAKKAFARVGVLTWKIFSSLPQFRLYQQFVKL